MGENANLVVHSSNIVSVMPHVSDKSFQKLEIFSIFHNYPCGIVNPAFAGMLLWEILYNHDLNDYEICEYHNIKSGIIQYGTVAYVFTQISNNDILSHVKILFREANLPHNLTPAGATKMMVKYVRYNASRLIIPSIPAIQHDLHQSMHVGDGTLICPGKNRKYWIIPTSVSVVTLYLMTYLKARQEWYYRFFESTVSRCSE